MSNNVDGYRLSTFLYKNKNSNGGKINIGPVWDYNIAYGNANYNNGVSTSIWCYSSVQSYTGAVPFWWAKLITDTVFKSSLKCRWIELRQSTMSNASIFGYIDSTATYINEAQQRHFQKWPILGVYVWPNPSPYPTTYQGEVTALKTWIQNRMTWLDANMPGTYSLPVVNLGNDTTVCPGQFTLNAANTGCTFLWNTGDTAQRIVANNAGLYAVTVSKNYGCKKTDSIFITLKPVPNVNAGNDTSICQGSNITLKATGGVSYVWNNNVLQNVSFIPIAPLYYTVTATGANGCTAKDSVKVDLIPLPAKPTISVVWGNIDTLISSAANGNQWYNNNAILMGENAQKLLVSSFINGNYTVVVTENGCNSEPSDILKINVGINKINKENFNVYPNPFTDNITIKCAIQTNDNLKVMLYDVMGRELKIPSKSSEDRGVFTLTFDTSLLNTGVYFVNINTGNNTFTTKLVK